MGLTEYGHIATEETQLRVADLLQAIAAGSAGPEYTDATFKALLDDTNTTEIFSAWWPLSAASNDSKYKRLLRFFTMLQTDKTYTVKFPSPAVSTNPAGTPADDLAGKSAAALATDSTNPEDWAAEDRMTWYIRANAVSLADGTMDVLAIEGEEEFDITGTLAPVYTFAPALLRRVIDDGSYLSKSWRSTLADGFTPYAENVAPNGKRRAMTWHATFPGGLNAKGALTSGAGLPVANFNSAVTGLALARKQTACTARRDRPGTGTWQRVPGRRSYVYASRRPRRRGNPGKHCGGFFRLVEVRRSMGRPGESPDCRGAPGRHGRFYGRNHGGLTHMSKYYTTARLLYRLHKITADQVWAYTESDPPKITEDEALAICGPRAKDETAGS